MLLNASLCEVSYNVVVYKIKVRKRMLENIKKKRAKTLIKTNKDIYLKIIIEKVK